MDESTKTIRNLAGFNTNMNKNYFYFLRLATWFVFQHCFFRQWFFPAKFRPFALRLWGAKIGKGVVIRCGVKIHFPWNLRVSNFCWIGEESWILNHAEVKIESNVAISQRVIICSGGHNYRDSSLKYDHKPILIKHGAWICLDAKVLPGVTVGECSVVSAGEIVRKSLPDYSLYVGGQIHAIKPPK